MLPAPGWTDERGASKAVELFTVQCPTCQRRLRVRDAAAIGAILACPKCGSFVEVRPPAGWTMPSDEHILHQTATGSGTSSQSSPSIKLPTAIPTAAAPKSTVPGTPAKAKPAKADPAARIAPVALAENAAAERAGQASTVPAVARTAARRSKMLVSSAAVLLGVAMMTGGAWREIHKSSRVALARPRSVTHAAPPAPPKTKSNLPPVATGPQHLSRRWLPAGTQAILSIRPALLAEADGNGTIEHHVHPSWNTLLDEVCQPLGITVSQIDRATWAMPQLAVWSSGQLNAQSVLVLEGNRPFGRDVRERLAAMKLSPEKWSPERLRFYSSPKLPFTVAVVGEQTVLLGHADLLRPLAAQAAEKSGFDALLEALDASAEITCVVDAKEWRSISPPGLYTFLGQWPATHAAWQHLVDEPQAIGITLNAGRTTELTLALLAENENAAKSLSHAITQVAEAGGGALAGEQGKAIERFVVGEGPEEETEQFAVLTQLARSGLDSFEARTDGRIASADVTLGGPTVDLVASYFKVAPNLERSRLAAARPADQHNVEQLMKGLSGFAKAEGTYPAGAAGATLLPPENRLSWMATILPYCEQPEWHRALEFGRPWNDPANQPTTREVFEIAVNPAFGVARSREGFPVTHYVGVAGLGADAATLAPDNPRAGVFGYARRPSLAIPDGASNTIAVLGLSSKLGPWAQGGTATVRGLTAAPYQDGPDGFGSGQSDGMFAGMADGSARFISKKVDPHVLEQLVTAAGGERPSIAALEAAGVKAPAAAPPKVAGSAPIAPPKVAVANPKPDKVAALPGMAKIPANGPLANGRPVDVPARLADPIAKADFENVPLSDFVDTLSTISALQITIDLEALTEAGNDPADPITVRQKNATVGQLLESALSQRGLEYLIIDNKVLVTTPKRRDAERVTENYDVADLIAGNPAGAGELQMLVEKMVAPGTWQSSGGAGLIEPGPTLKVTQGAGTQQQVGQFLNRLRIARGLANPQPGEPSITPKWTLARDRLSMLVSANFPQPVELSTALELLEQQGEVRILVDQFALSGKKLGRHTLGRLAVNKVPLGDALGQLLEPLGLGYRPVAADILQVTTQQVLAASLETEFYPAAPLLGPKRTPETLVEQLQVETGAAAWAGGGGAGQMVFDRPSRNLIVLNNQPVQHQVAEWFAQRANPVAGNPQNQAKR